MKNDKLQEKINAFVMKCIGQKYDQEQTTGFTMFEFQLFYNEAKKRVKTAYQLLKS